MLCNVEPLEEPASQEDRRRTEDVTWGRRPALPLGALHHVLGDPLGAALLPLLLHQLLQLHPASVGAALVGGAGGLLQDRTRRTRWTRWTRRTVSHLQTPTCYCWIRPRSSL